MILSSYHPACLRSLNDKIVLSYQAKDSEYLTLLEETNYFANAAFLLTDIFLATILALHFTPVSQSVGRSFNWCSFEACELVIKLIIFKMGQNSVFTKIFLVFWPFTGPFSGFSKFQN